MRIRREPGSDSIPRIPRTGTPCRCAVTALWQQQCQRRPWQACGFDGFFAAQHRLFPGALACMFRLDHCAGPYPSCCLPFAACQPCCRCCFPHSRAKRGCPPAACAAASTTAWAEWKIIPALAERSTAAAQRLHTQSRHPRRSVPSARLRPLLHASARSPACQKLPPSPLSPPAVQQARRTRGYAVAPRVAAATLNVALLAARFFSEASAGRSRLRRSVFGKAQ